MEKTGIQYIPVSSWTMEKEGAKQVEITGLKDKQQITTVFAAEKDSYFLPLKIIYREKLTTVYQQSSFLVGGTSPTQQVVGLMRRLL